MKKKTIISLLIVLLMLCGCGNKNSSTSTDSETNNSSETVTVDEGLLDVTITLPNSFFESFDTTAEKYVESIKEGEGNDVFKKVEINNDGSVSITMTRANYNAFMDDMAKSVESSLQELIDSNEYSFASIDHDSKFENFTVKLSTNEMGFGEQFSVLAFALYGGIYQMFAGNENPRVFVKYIGENGSELYNWDSLNTNN